MDRTWSPAEMRVLGPWVLRRGLGGGKRVSAATTESDVSQDDILAAENGMAALGQQPIFMLTDGGERLDTNLAALGYRVVDPVLILVGGIAGVAAGAPPPLAAIPCAEPLAIMSEFWEANGISQARQAVMRRTSGPKTHIFARHGDRPAGATFVACDGNIAMLHALAVAPSLRRKGIAANVLARAAIWGMEQGAEYLSVVTTGENLPAQGLFTGAGMQVVGRYHYRMK